MELLTKANKPENLGQKQTELILVDFPKMCVASSNSKNITCIQ